MHLEAGGHAILLHVFCHTVPPFGRRGVCSFKDNDGGFPLRHRVTSVTRTVKIWLGYFQHFKGVKGA